MESLGMGPEKNTRPDLHHRRPAAAAQERPRLLGFPKRKSFGQANASGLLAYLLFEDG